MTVALVTGLTTMSLLHERSHRAGMRWNISGSVVAAFEPFLLSLSDDIMTLWDRRDGSPIQNMTVEGQVLGVIAALMDIGTGQKSESTSFRANGKEHFLVDYMCKCMTDFML